MTQSDVLTQFDATFNELFALKSIIKLTREICLDKEVNSFYYNLSEEYKKSLKLFMDYAPIAITGRLLNETKVQLENDYKKRELANNQHSRNLIVSEITSEMLLMLTKLPIEKDLSLQLQEGIQDIVAKELRKPYYAQVRVGYRNTENNTVTYAYSSVLKFAISDFAYAARQQGSSALKPLSEALMRYGDAAAAYFNSLH